MDKVGTSRVRFVSETGSPALSIGPAIPPGEHDTSEAPLVRYHTPNEAKCETRCNIIFPQSIYQRIVAHLKYDTSREHGGFLLGYEYRNSESEVPTVVIEDAVEGRFTEGTPVRLKFTVDTFRDLDETVESRRAPGRVLQRIGWYHSHPNISIFLSHWDLDVCTVFDRRQFPIALVVDPVNDRGGFFVRGKSGYQADCPQGFLEKADISQDSLVTWSNMARETPPLERKSEEQPAQPDGQRQPIVPPYQRVLYICAIVALATSCFLALNQWRMWKELKALRSGPAGLLLSPDSVTLKPGEKTQFTVLSNGASATSDIHWSLDPPDEGAGTISSDGVYQAPPPPSADRTITVKAISASKQVAVVVVKLLSEPSPQAETLVRIDPPSAEVEPGGTVAFHVIGANAPAKWAVQGAGKISSKGVYTAPKELTAVSAVKVIAENSADRMQLAVATVLVQPPTESPKSDITVKLTPQTKMLNAGEKVTLSAEVTGTKNHRITWSYSPPVGQLHSGTYTAPHSVNRKQVITITISSQADPAKRDSATITLKPSTSASAGQASTSNTGATPGAKPTDQNSQHTLYEQNGAEQAGNKGSDTTATASPAKTPVSVAVLPASRQLAPGGSQIFVANVTGTDDRSVTWSVDNAEIGSITQEGHFTAAAGITNRVSGTVKATSKSDPTKSGSATVVVAPAVAKTSAEQQ